MLGPQHNPGRPWVHRTHPSYGECMELIELMLKWIWRGFGACSTTNCCVSLGILVSLWFFMFSTVMPATPGVFCMFLKPSGKKAPLPQIHFQKFHRRSLIGSSTSPMVRDLDWSHLSHMPTPRAKQNWNTQWVDQSSRWLMFVPSVYQWAN